ncbi:annexin A13-like [Pollicipes pollicipes]|uniref:annexin A13-like n=1 Tax=Pollicipes pollicipes TaxID=41117 RepID=UPI00188529F8|nr:annexin A13-like [Pollicipes pollicipes]XP_037076046.1 annexin A13-like [Pollicipes pollicipes]
MKGGTIKSTGGLSDSDADKLGRRLRKSMNGIGTDERVIIEILTKNGCEDRETIADRYKKQFGRDLKDDLKAELGGNFESAVLALCEQNSHHYLAQWCRKAIRGLGTDENTLIEIICGCKRDMVAQVDAAYKYQFRRSLEEDIESEMSGDVKRLMVALLQDGRENDDVGVSPQRSKDLAQELYEAGEGMNSGTDEETFIRIFCTTNYPQLKKTFEEYTKFADNSIENAIEKEFSGDLKEALLTVVLCVKDQNAYFAKVLHDAMKGAGTDDDTLIRILVTRSEIDLEDIKEAFKKAYKKTLAEAVTAETSGDYQKILLAIIK